MNQVTRSLSCIDGKFQARDGMPIDLELVSEWPAMHIRQPYGVDAGVVRECNGVQFCHADGVFRDSNGSPDARYIFDEGELGCQVGSGIFWRRGMAQFMLDYKFHRDDGPAFVMTDGRQIYCRNGKLHRDSGPAIVAPDGTGRWFRNGIETDESGTPVVFDSPPPPSLHGSQAILL